MKIFEKVAKKLGKTASDGAIENVKQTAMDILPAILNIGGLIVTGFIFSRRSKNDELAIPDVQTMHITINNYYK